MASHSHAPLASPTPPRPSQSSVQPRPLFSRRDGAPASQRVLGYLYERASVRASGHSLDLLGSASNNLSWPLHSHVPLTSPTPHCPSPPSAHPAPTLLMLRAIPPRRGCHQPAPRLLTPRRSPCAAPLPLHQLDRVSSASSAAETYSIALPSQTGPTLRAKALRATVPQTQTLHSPPRPAQRRSATACVRRGRSSSAAS